MEEHRSSLENLRNFNESFSSLNLNPSMDNNEEEDNDADFSFIISTSDRYNERIPDITADELFSHGKILPVYPIFGKPNSFKNSISKDENDISASVYHPEPEASGEFCDWVPNSAPASPERCRKSRSTGSAKKWTFHDYLSGKRSHSDGKEKFVFLTKDNHNNKDNNMNKEKEMKPKDMGKTYKKLYVNDKEEKKEKEKGKRRSYLPYVGFFGGGGLNEGFSRTRYPY